MRFLIRTDGDPRIGGGHVMRCLTLAEAARARGHDVAFVTAVSPGSMAERIRAAGFGAVPVLPVAHDPAADPRAPVHAGWLVAPWEEDARITAEAVAKVGTDWVIVDHYGLDDRWAARVRRGRPELRIMALDDLDDRALGADIVLDQTRLSGVRQNAGPAQLTGPDFALLRPEFAAAREAALARRGGSVARVLVAPGMGDAVGLVPLALTALDGFPSLRIDVAMGSASQSRTAVEARPDVVLHLDATDMAALMTAADLCIGAGGMTGWERCCLGLPAVAVAVADNQVPALNGLAEAGAVVALTLDAARSGSLREAVAVALKKAPELSAAAARLCDGKGADRVLDALEGGFRPVTEADALLLFDWRNRPAIRAVSHNKDALVWEEHVAWLNRALTRDDAIYRIWTEGGRDIGHASARDTGDGVWQWSFYIGAADAPKGAGGRMMAAFARHLFARPDAVSIRAEVVAGNTQSESLHRRLGFRQTDAAGGTLVFTLTRCDHEARLGLAMEGHQDG